MVLFAAGQAVTILDRISFTIPAQQSVAIVGPSGSGKSTLLGLMAGLDHPTSGSIILDRTDITTMTESRMAQFRREKIGYIFQSFHLIPTLTAIENVGVPLELSGEKRAGDRAAELLSAVGLSDRMGHYPVQLSGENSSVSQSHGLLPVDHRSSWPMSRRVILTVPPGHRSWSCCCHCTAIMGPPWSS